MSVASSGGVGGKSFQDIFDEFDLGTSQRHVRVELLVQPEDRKPNSVQSLTDKFGVSVDELFGSFEKNALILSWCFLS